MVEKKVYRKPPIVERIVGVYADIAQETLESKLPTWEARIKDQYPNYDPISEWEINVKEVHGIPVLQDTQAKAKIIHLYWKKHPKGRKVYAMRLRSDRLVFHLRREEDDSHNFDELLSEFKTWLDPWMQHFEVSTFKGVTLEYRNLLNPTLTPQFVSEDGKLKVEEALVFFSNIPGRFQDILPPYDCRARVLVDRDRRCVFDVRVREEAAHGIVIDFAVRTVARDKSISREQGLEEIQFAHQIMLEEFDCFFTPKAKESFD